MRRARDSSSSESFSSSISTSNRRSSGISCNDADPSDYTIGYTAGHNIVNIGNVREEENVRNSIDSVFESEQNWIEKTLAPEPSTTDSLQLPPSGQNGHKMSIESETGSNTDRLLKSSLINGPRTGPRKSVRMLEDIETSDIPIKIK